VGVTEEMTFGGSDRRDDLWWEWPGEMAFCASCL
jgi:hypothetical protein